MSLFLSHRIDRLVELLAERLAGGAPFSETWVLLASQNSKQWLQVALTERMPGQAIAGLQFLTWREAILRICRASCPVPDVFELGAAISQQFSKEIPSPLKSLLASPFRLSALIQPLSRQMREAGFYGMEKAKDWQKLIFQALAIDGPWRFPVQILPNLISTNRQIHCFGLDDLPACAWDFFCRSQNVSIYLFSPCRMFWEDVCSDQERRFLSRRFSKEKVSDAALETFESLLRDTHPLLANWGRLGRQTKRLLEEKSLEIVEAYEGSEEDLITAQEKFRSGKFSLLESLQHDLLFLHGHLYSSPDSSLEIVAAGVSRLREVQILKDNIMRYLARSQGLYSDVLVLASDIRAYEPLIHFVFGDDLPYRISPVSVLYGNPFLQGLLHFFDLANGRFDVDEVMELFENPSFQAKHKLMPEDLQQFLKWLREAKVRGSWDEKRKGNWADGLKRMIFGLVYLLPEEEILPRIASMDWGQAERLDLFLTLMQLLQKQAEQFQGHMTHTLEEWAELLKSLAELLFEPKEGEAELFHAFLRKLISSHFAKDSFSFSLLLSFFEADCNAASSAYQPLSLETVQCSTLEPGSIRPARAIFLLGMESGHFPRNEPAASLDWTYAGPDAFEQGRYLFLQTIFAAQEYLCMSYCHLSPDDGKTVDPALPVQELKRVTSARTITHPSLPQDARSIQFSPTIFWTKQLAVEKKEARVFSLDDFQLLSRNPWKYFLQRRLGIYLKEESLFSELRLEDFSLPAYQERRWLKLALQRPIEEVLEQIEHDLPPGHFGKWAAEQFKNRAFEWKKHLQKWGIDPESISSRRIEPIVISPTIQIVGELDFFTSEGLLMTGDLKFFDLLRNWPALLVFLDLANRNNGTLYSLKKGTSKTFQGIDAKAALCKWIEYACRAEESLSPLIEPWADAFLRKDLVSWKEMASIETSEDPAIRWIVERSRPLPFLRLGEEWGAFLKETFADLINHV